MHQPSFEPEFSAILVYDPKVGQNQGMLFPDWPTAEEYRKDKPGLEARCFLMAELPPE